MTVLADIFPERFGGYWGVAPGESEIDALAIRNGDIGTTGSIDWESLPTRAYTAKEAGKAMVRAGDILLTTSGNCGNVAFISSEPMTPTLATNFVRVLRVDPERTHAKFAFHYLRTRRFRDEIAPFIRGATIKNLSVESAFGVVGMPFPSFEEQRRIAAILDQAAEVRAKGLHALANLDRLVEARFRELLSNQGIEVRGLGDVAQFFAGNSLPTGTEFAGEAHGYLLMKVSDMNRVGNEREIRSTALWSETPGSKAGTCPPGAIILPKRGGAIGTNKKRVTTRPTVLDPNLMGVVPSDELDLTYLLHWFLQFDLGTISNGSSVPQLNKKDLAPLLIPVPTASVQCEFAEFAKNAEAVAKVHRDRLEQLRVLFESLQNRAFAGAL